MPPNSAVIIAAIGLTLLIIGIYFVRFPDACGPDENRVDCLRAWLAAIGPFIAAAALLIAFQQFGLNEDTRNRQLRAYVSLISGAIAPATVDGAPGIRVLITLNNSGVTPGYGFTTWMRPPLILEPSAVPFGEPTPIAQRAGKSIIAPGTSAHMTVYYRWQPNEVEQVRSGEKAIFVWGGANYTDAFNKDRMFVFRIAVSGPENENNNRSWALSPHRLGYDAD